MGGTAVGGTGVGGTAVGGTAVGGTDVGGTAVSIGGRLVAVGPGCVREGSTTTVLANETVDVGDCVAVGVNTAVPPGWVGTDAVAVRVKMTSVGGTPPGVPNPGVTVGTGVSSCRKISCESWVICRSRMESSIMRNANGGNRSIERKSAL